MSKPEFAVGDFIQVIGYPCSTVICLGLTGYISQIDEKKEGRYIHVELLKNSTPDMKEIDQERCKRFSAWSCPVRPDEIRHINHAPWGSNIPRLTRFKNADMAEAEMHKNNPATKLILDEVGKELKPYADNEKAIDRYYRSLANIFPLPGYTERGDKSHYPAYNTTASRKVDDEVYGYASRGLAKCEPKEVARWRLGNQFLERVSFWSPRQECRDAVREFDLDPFKEDHNHALYRDHQIKYVENGFLRNMFIDLWNLGAEIINVNDATKREDNHIQIVEPTENPTGFSVTFAFRRTLPNRLP